MALRFTAALLSFWSMLSISCAPGFAQSSAMLTAALAILDKHPPASKTMSLVAEVSQEGHWTFANANRERFTTASPEELKRVLPTLAPDFLKQEAGKPAARLTLLLTEDTVFRQRQHFQALPLAHDKRTDLMIAVDREAYPLFKRGEQLFAAIRPGLAVELNLGHDGRRLFDETVWQLAHPLKKGSVRILALEPGGPASVAPSPRPDPQSGRPLTDQIAPASLTSALATLARQTVILTARRDGDSLAFRPSSGPEQTLPIKDVLAAAEAADVNLVLLQSTTPRQPGTRSWLWQRVSVTRLDDAISRDHLADFLNALATPQSRLLVSAQDAGNGRIRLRAEPVKIDGSTRGGFGEQLSDIVSNIAGQVVVSSVEASLRERTRQTELDRRIIPGLPSMLQFAYLGLIALGLAGHAVARQWWARIWPPETRDGYSNALGFQIADAVRKTAYALVFLPLTAMASAPLALLRVFRPSFFPPP